MPSAQPFFLLLGKVHIDYFYPESQPQVLPFSGARLGKIWPEG